MDWQVGNGVCPSPVDASPFACDLSSLFLYNFLLHFWRIIYWKCPSEKPGDGISETLNFKIFGGSMPPDPPRCKCLRLLRKIYSRAYIFKIPCYAPVVYLCNSFEELTHYIIRSFQDSRRRLYKDKALSKNGRRKNYSLLFWMINYHKDSPPT